MRADNCNIGMQTLNWIIVFSTLLLTIARTCSENESETKCPWFRNFVSERDDENQGSLREKNTEGKKVAISQK